MRCPDLDDVDGDAFFHDGDGRLKLLLNAPRHVVLGGGHLRELAAPVSRDEDLGDELRAGLRRWLREDARHVRQEHPGGRERKKERKGGRGGKKEN